MRQSDFLAVFHSNCSINEWVCASRKNKLGTEGGRTVKEDSNTILKNRLYLFDRVLTERPGGFKIPQGTGKWQLVSEIIQHELSLSN